MTFIKTGFAGLAGAVIAGLCCSCTPDPSALPGDREALLAGAVRIAAGEYEIGSHEPGSWPVRRVQVKEFYIWPTETPQAWWQAYKADAGLQAERLPVATITYDEAVAFCAWMSNRFGVSVRLPSADEWLVAAQAGTPGTPFPWGWNQPEGRAVFSTNAPQPVAQFPPNAFGLYDVAGNVAEWAAADNPILAPVMGGSWAEQDADFLRISSQMILPRMYKGKDTGFRIAIDP